MASTKKLVSRILTSSIEKRDWEKVLKKSEKRIIDYILANLKTVMSQTISDLASNTQSSEITISRFCKKLGFSGLQSLKIALASEVYSQDELVSQEINPNDSYKLIAEKLFSSITDGLQDTLKLIDFEQLEKAVQLIKKCSSNLCIWLWQFFYSLPRYRNTFYAFWHSYKSL